MLILKWSYSDVGQRRLRIYKLESGQRGINAYGRRCGWPIEGKNREAVFRQRQRKDLLQVAILKTEFDELGDAGEYIHCVGRLKADDGIAGPDVSASVSAR